jgi:hypothetical protein
MFASIRALRRRSPPTLASSYNSKGNEEFNAWSERVGRSHLEPNQPVLYVVIKKLRPDRSRIQELDLVKV